MSAITPTTARWLLPLLALGLVTLVGLTWAFGWLGGEPARELPEPQSSTHAREQPIPEGASAPHNLPGEREPLPPTAALDNNRPGNRTPAGGDGLGEQSPDPSTAPSGPWRITGEVVDGLGLGLHGLRDSPAGTPAGTHPGSAWRWECLPRDPQLRRTWAAGQRDHRRRRPLPAELPPGETAALRRSASGCGPAPPPGPPPQLAADRLALAGVPTTLDLGTLVLRTGPTLRISVRAPNGAPLAGSRVLIQPMVDDPFLPPEARALRTRSGRTDDAGDLLLYAPPDGSYEILAVAEGHGWGSTIARLPRPGAGGARVTLTLDRELQLRGRIRAPDGRTLAGVPLVLWPPLGGGPPARTRSQGDGAFAFRHLAPGPHRLTAEVDGRGTVELAGVDPEGGFVEVTLPEGSVLSGRVLHQGRAVAGARVTAEPDGAPVIVQGDSFLRPTTRTGPDGRFQMEGLPAGSFRLRVASEGLPPVVAGPFVTDGVPVTVNLPMPATASGRVLDAGGRALEDAVIQLLPAEHDGSAAADLKLRILRGSPPPTARSDAAGRFVLRGFEAGSWRLHVRTDHLGTARQHIRWRSAPRAIGAGDTAVWPPIRLERGPVSSAPPGTSTAPPGPEPGSH